MMGVSGRAGNPAYPDDVAPADPVVPFPAAPRRIARAFIDLGWSWWPADMAINLRPTGQGAANAPIAGHAS